MKQATPSTIWEHIGKLSLAVLLACSLVAEASAAPAKRMRHMLTLADGTSIEAVLMGDETLHYFQTDDGRCLQCDSSGIARFVDAETQRASKVNAARRIRQRNAARLAKRRSASAGTAMTGSKRGLVVLAEFTDVHFSLPGADFQRLFNEKGYSDATNSGSVRDYFLDQSYGQFDFCFDVVGPITLPHPRSYYGNNNSAGDDLLPATMVADALRLADAHVNFRDYDWDGDGEAEHVYVIHAGYDEAQSGTNADIWSHAWTLTEAAEENPNDGHGAIVLDGTRIDSYATSAELQGRIGKIITGIGTICHEFSHCFGLPDIYDTLGRNFGMDVWDIMDYGNYLGGDNSGGTPAGFTSYERMFCGWLRPTVLEEPIMVGRMPALTDAPEAFILYNSGTPNEYYLLENRQKKGWDSYLPSHGLLILHVDYDAEAWEDNEVNVDASHPRLTIIPADNIRSRFTVTGDTWPGTRGKTELTDTSSPAAMLYQANANGKYSMGHSITEIAETPDGHIAFRFDKGLPDAIEALPSPSQERESYNLWGQPVGRTYTGIIISNGRKLWQK